MNRKWPDIADDLRTKKRVASHSLQHYLMTLPLVILAAAISSTPTKINGHALGLEIIAWTLLVLASFIGFLSRYAEIQALELKAKYIDLEIESIQLAEAYPGNQPPTDLVIDLRAKKQSHNEKVDKNEANRYFLPKLHVYLLAFGIISLTISRMIILISSRAQ